MICESNNNSYHDSTSAFFRYFFPKKTRTLMPLRLFQIKFSHLMFIKIFAIILRWCRAPDLFGSQIPVTKRGFELRISCIRSSYLTHLAIRVTKLLWGSQIKSSCGHWNLWSKWISGTTPAQFETWIEVEVFLTI